MVDVTEKKATHRTARARAIVDVGKDVLRVLRNNAQSTSKGSVFQTAIIAGITGAKKTGDLIPLCHPLGLDSCDVDISIKKGKVVIETVASITSKTGVEMEALTAASIAALTVYDMCKALSHDIVIERIELLEKTGGKKDIRRNTPL